MKHTRLFQFLIIASLLFAVAGSPQQPAPAVKAQSQLVQMAIEKPGALADVIVQKVAGTTGTEERVAALGGKVTADLHIINAFAAEMTTAAAVKLAQSESVRWVSLDEKMVSSACANCVDTTHLANAYIYAIRANQVWNTAPYLQGQGIGVAIVDSGINPSGDLYTVMGVD
jgi:hypothetical protein